MAHEQNQGINQWITEVSAEPNSIKFNKVIREVNNKLSERILNLFKVPLITPY